MQVVSRALRSLLIVLCVLGVIYAVVTNYSYVFSKSVRGEVMEVERVMQPSTVIGSSVTPDQMFSFAVLVRSESGEIFSSSSIDRQWAIVRKGMCVEVRLYPYPPWDFEKADTYFNARLVRVLNECKHAAAADASPAAAPAAPGAPAAPAAAPVAPSAPSGAAPSAPVASPFPTPPATPLPLPGTGKSAQPGLPLHSGPKGMSN